MLVPGGENMFLCWLCFAKQTAMKYVGGVHQVLLLMERRQLPNQQKSNLLKGWMTNQRWLHICLLKTQEEIIKVDLEKPPSGGLGFSVIGGERGIFVKSITPGGVAESSGKLQVGDRLLKVSVFGLGMCFVKQNTLHCDLLVDLFFLLLFLTWIS